MTRITKIETVKNSETAKKRVAAYCRVSTDNSEQLDSLEAQKTHYEQVIASNPLWEPAGLFFDEGITGTSIEGRTGFKQMVESCKAGLIDLVITKSISRFARNTEDALRTIRTLKRMDIAVFFERENINTLEMEGEMLLSILASMAQDESESISKNVKWTIQKKFQNGTYVVSTPAYGYKNVDKRMVVDEEASKVVKRIFSYSLSGWGADKIANALNREGIKAPRGERWHSSTIYGILVNEVYLGVLRLQKTYSDSEFKAKRNHGELPQFIVENHHPALIKREDYDSVQNIIASNRKFKSIQKGSCKYQVRYLFSGKLVCADCGHKLKRKVCKTPDGERVSWSCSLHLKDSKACSLGYIQDESIKNACETMRNKLIFANELIMKPLLSIAKASSEEAKAKETFEEDISENLRKRQHLRELLGKGYIDPVVFAEENSQLLEEHQRLTDEKNSIEFFAKQKNDRAESISLLYHYLKTSEIKEQFDENFFIAFVEKIKVYSNHRIGFCMKCGLEFKEVI